MIISTLYEYTKLDVAQSAGAVEYTDYFSTEGYDECPGFNTKQSDSVVTVMLELWGMRSTLHCHRSQVHSGPECEQLIGSYLWVK